MVMWVVVPIGILADGTLSVLRQLRDGNDFPIYWGAAHALLAGASPYEVGSGLHGFVYLPWFALAMAPLALLPIVVAAWVWYLANLAFLWYSGRALLAALRHAGVTLRGWVPALATLPLVGLLHDNLQLGQANLFLLWLVSLGIREAQRAGAPAHRGVPFGWAAALKMPAAVLVLPLLVRRRFMVVLGVVLSVALAVGLPLLEGGGTGVRLLQDWRAKVIAPAAAGTLQGSSIIDQSPQAALRRLLVAAPAFDGHAVNVASLEQPTFARVSRITSLVFLLGYVIVWLFAPRRDSARALLLDLALGCCAMVQLTGFNLKAQFVVLLLPAWLAASLAWEQRWRTRRTALVVAGALFLLSQPGLVGRTASNWMLAYSSMTVATIILAKVLAWQRLTPSPSDAPAAAPPPGTAP